MSEDLVEEAVEKCCTNCGKAEIDDIKLKDCDKCDLARYCGDECKQNHLDIHEEICKERAAELRDEILFRQNEGSYLGDCPICFLPLPLVRSKSTLKTCCGKVICNGCNFAHCFREFTEQHKEWDKFRCPFCRKPMKDTPEECKKEYEKRVAANDPVALQRLGLRSHEKGDYEGAFEYSSRAAELGDVTAHFSLARMYLKGEGVERDEKMAEYHFEEAAIGGHPDARYFLGAHEWNNKRYDRAVKHLVIAANLGHDDSLQKLKYCYKCRQVSKDDLAQILRAHHAAVSAMNSPQREEAAKYKYRS